MKNDVLSHAAHRDCVALIHENKTERMVSSSALLGQRDVLVIRHEDEQYTLRKTRAGKLILTK